MRRRSPIIALALMTFMLMYALLLAGTFNGILTPELNVLTMALISTLGVLWLLARWRLKWSQTRSPLETVVILWLAAAVFSLLANQDSSRRIIIGLWYMLMYIVVWFALADIISHRLIERNTLIDALLIIGSVMIFFGFLQFINLLPIWVRPVSVLGNPNLLAGFLLMVIPFATERAGARRGIVRWTMALYGLSGLLLLVLTFSRGGWVGFGGGMLARLLLYALEHRLYVRENRRQFLAEVPRRVVFLVAGVSTLVITGGTAVLLWSLTLAGRSVGLRTFVYDTAITLFAQHPLTGTGLFTFGEGLARLNSMPMTQPHSHAHNLVLNVAAETGLPGVLVLALTLWLIWRGLRANYSQLNSRDLTAFRAGVFALGAFGTHQLLDLPAMVPTIFLTMLIALVVTLAPPQPQTIRRTWQPFAFAAALVVLIVGGWFGALTYRQYVDTLSGVDTATAGTRASALQAVIDLDPAMPVYIQQQGYLYAVNENYPAAITAYEHYTRMVPYYSPGWANLAAAYAGASRYADAVTALERAAALAPHMQPFYACALEAYRAERLPTFSADPDPFSSDWVFQQDFNTIQYLRLSLPRLYLPALGMPTYDAIVTLGSSPWLCP